MIWHLTSFCSSPAGRERRSRQIPGLTFCKLGSHHTCGAQCHLLPGGTNSHAFQSMPCGYANRAARRCRRSRGSANAGGSAVAAHWLIESALGRGTRARSGPHQAILEVPVWWQRPIMQYRTARGACTAVSAPPAQCAVGRPTLGHTQLAMGTAHAESHVSAIGCPMDGVNAQMERGADGHPPAAPWLRPVLRNTSCRPRLW